MSRHNALDSSLPTVCLQLTFFHGIKFFAFLKLCSKLLIGERSRGNPPPLTGVRFPITMALPAVPSNLARFVNEQSVFC